MQPRLLLVIGALLLETGCATYSEPALQRETTAVMDESKTLTVLKEISIYGRGPEQRGFMLPMGIYILEAEDAGYWYFRSPTTVEFRIVQGMQVIAQRRLPGGVRIPKDTNAAAPPGYFDVPAGKKEIISEITAAEFVWMEGRYWKKSF